MTENSDKYRALHDFVTDPSKAELFGMGSLFGGLKENHTVLKLFAIFVNDLKQKYHHVPTVINSKTFIEYINSEPTLDQGKKEKLVKKIQYIHKKGIIQDEPIARNTLYNFALVLNDLNIGEKKDLILPQYARALEVALRLPDKGQRVETKTSSEQAKSSEQIRPGESMDAKSTNLGGEIVSTGDVSIMQSTGTEDGYSLSVSEEDEEKESLEADVDEAKTPNKNGAAVFNPSIIPGSVPITEQGEERALGRLAAGSPMDNGLNKPNLFPEGNDENLQKPQSEEYQQKQITEIERTDTTGLSPLPQEETGKTPTIVPGQNQSQVQRQMQVAPQQATPRRVISTGKGLRRPMNRPKRLSELSPKEIQSSKDAQNTKNTTQQDQQQADQIPLIPQRSTTEGGSTNRDSGKKSSFGKKLAKLAGAGVGAGVILPLFAGGSAEAANFALHNNFSFIQKIIGLLF